MAEWLTDFKRGLSFGFVLFQNESTTFDKSVHSAIFAEHLKIRTSLF